MHSGTRSQPQQKPQLLEAGKSEVGFDEVGTYQQASHTQYYRAGCQTSEDESFLRVELDLHHMQALLQTTR